MNYDINKAKKDIELMQSLKQQKDNMLEKYDFIPNTEDEDELISSMEEIDKKINEIEEILISHAIENQNEIEMLKTLQEKYQLQIEIMFEYNNIISNMHTLEKKIIASVLNSRLAQQSSMISKEKITPYNYREILDNLCLQSFKVPLLVALITNDPSDIMREINSVLELCEVDSEIKKEILQYIELEKKRIDENLILSDKTVIDLIENSTGRNIMSESLEPGRVIEKNGGTGYSVIRNTYGGINRHTYGGGHIVKFKNVDRNTGENIFNRKSNDMFIRDFPNSTSEELMFRSFSSLPNERKAEYIKVVLDNLELCYDMFKSYYMNDKIVIPTRLNLTNGEEMDYYFYRWNLPHILGISKISDLPPRTIQALKLNSLEYNEKGNIKDILEKILEKKEIIIRNCGLIKDPSTNVYYELLPWEKIILKTNAFIRGDYFKQTSLITTVNSKSGLFSPSIQRISLTGTQFAKSALNQPLPNNDEISKLKRKNQEMDFIIKGMCFDERKKMWVPQSNASAMGERIILDNSSRVKTLERYRRALEDLEPSTGGGLIASVENEKFTNPKEYSNFELAQALVDISLSFGDSKKIAENIKELFKQIEYKEIKRKQY